MDKDKRKAKQPNFPKGSKPHCPSRSNGNANIIINPENAIPKLEKLAKDYEGYSNPYGFITNVTKALGIYDPDNASKYGEISLTDKDKTQRKVSIRVTNHNSNAETYINHNANYEYNLSIVVKLKQRKNKFKPHDDVVLEEFVYFGKLIEPLESPLSQIIRSIIRYLQDGTYIDTTKVAKINVSPQKEVSNKDVSNNKTSTDPTPKVIKDSFKYDRANYVQILKEMLMDLY